MNNEEKILSTLDIILEKLDDHTKRFESIDERFDTVDDRFESVDERFDMVDKRFESVDEQFDSVEDRFKSVDDRFDLIDEKLKEHSEHLSALRTGQEFLKAEADGVKIANAKEFGTLRKEMEEYVLNFNVLRDEVWEQKVDIKKIKKTVGTSGS